MSIKSELNNTKHYLRESRKAILGRGGEISATAGLKDFPQAIYNIPADTSLAFQEDSSVAYEKIVPSGAEEYALVKSLGGMSYKDEETQTLRDTKPTSLESRGANSAEPIDTLALPEAVQSLDGWGLGINGLYNNHIEYRNGRIIYVQEAKEYEFKGTEWFWLNDYLNSQGVKGYQVGAIAPREISLCSHFKCDMWEVVSITAKYTAFIIKGSGVVFVTDGTQTLDEFKAYLVEQYNMGNPVTMIYPIAPIETDITHLFTNPSPFFKVQGGGIVIFHNERKQAVPATLKYTIKVG